MYSRSEAIQIKKEFWTRFGLYMKPVKNAAGHTTNWVNYKTGVRHIYFRMDAGKRAASVAIELKHPQPEDRESTYNKFVQLKTYLENVLQETWDWEPLFYDEDGLPASRIIQQLPDVNVFNQADWPAIISFLKDGIMKLDLFWTDVKPQFEGAI